jgi:hypothetical protein
MHAMQIQWIRTWSQADNMELRHHRGITWYIIRTPENQDNHNTKLFINLENLIPIVSTKSPELTAPNLAPSATIGLPQLFPPSGDRWPRKWDR